MRRPAGNGGGARAEETEVAGKWDVVVVGAGNAAFCAAQAAAQNRRQGADGRSARPKS